MLFRSYIRLYGEMAEMDHVSGEMGPCLPWWARSCLLGRIARAPHEPEGATPAEGRLAPAPPVGPPAPIIEVGDSPEWSASSGPIEGTQFGDGEPRHAPPSPERCTREGPREVAGYGMRASRVGEASHPGPAYSPPDPSVGGVSGPTDIDRIRAAASRAMHMAALEADIDRRWVSLQALAREHASALGADLAVNHPVFILDLDEGSAYDGSSSSSDQVDLQEFWGSPWRDFRTRAPTVEDRELPDHDWIRETASHWAYVGGLEDRIRQEWAEMAELARIRAVRMGGMLDVVSPFHLRDPRTGGGPSPPSSVASEPDPGERSPRHHPFSPLSTDAGPAFGASSSDGRCSSWSSACSSPPAADRPADGSGHPQPAFGAFRLPRQPAPGCR